MESAEMMMWARCRRGMSWVRLGFIRSVPEMESTSSEVHYFPVPQFTWTRSGTRERNLLSRLKIRPLITLTYRVQTKMESHCRVQVFVTEKVQPAAFWSSSWGLNRINNGQR